MTAYEELKVWCAKHLVADDYKVVPESHSYFATIYFTDNGICYLSFDRDGRFCGMGSVDVDDMCEHINEYERENNIAPEDDVSSEIVVEPPLSTIGGMMVRKMIEAYERNQQ